VLKDGDFQSLRHCFFKDYSAISASSSFTGRVKGVSSEVPATHDQSKSMPRIQVI
jgi:hypothetical protein